MKIQELWIMFFVSETVYQYGKCSKNLEDFFSFCSHIKCWLSGLEVHKCLSEYQTGKTLIRLLSQKQADLG